MTPARTGSLGAVVDIIRGVTFRPDDLVQPNGEATVACFRTSNIQDDLDLSDVWHLPRSFARRAPLLLREGDTLMSTANSWNLVGKCAWVPSLPWDSVPGGFIAAVRAREESIIPRFLFHWLRSPDTQASLRNCANKTTNISNLSIERCLALEIAIPPLGEQRRIVAILDQADDLRRRRRFALKKLNEVPQAIFHDMFGPARTKSKDCPVRPLGDLVSVSSGNGLTQNQLVAGPFPVYGGNGINGYHSDFMVPPGTVVIGRVGVYCGAVHVTTSSAWVTDNALIVSAKSDAVLPTYLSAALINANLNQYAGRSTQPLISGGRLYPIEIPVPPLAEQERFALSAAAAAATAEVSLKQLHSIDKLFSSLQNRAFREL